MPAISWGWSRRFKVCRMPPAQGTPKKASSWAAGDDFDAGEKLVGALEERGEGERKIHHRAAHSLSPRQWPGLRASYHRWALGIRVAFSKMETAGPTDSFPLQIG